MSDIPSRDEILTKLKENNHFDIIIIGGGITGAGVARDAIMRGLRVALFEKSDFGSGTSMQSSKLLHGGLRYLKNYEFKLVREAALERKIHQEIAPHLSETMEFLLPLYSWNKESKTLLKMGLILYDLLAFPKRLGKHKMLSAEELTSKLKLLENNELKGGALYHDCRTDDTRLALANILSAVSGNGIALNYAEVKSWVSDEEETEVEIYDHLNRNEIKAYGDVLIICGGPWTDVVESRGITFNGKSKLRLTRGTHLIVKKKLGKNPCLLVNDDDRPIYLIPRMDYDLVGTTDVDYQGIPDDIFPTNNDKDYLLNAMNKIFPTVHYTDEDIVAAFAGVRPLVYKEGINEGKVSREHKIFVDKEKGVITVIGGKLTTYRVMAKQAVDQALKLLHISKRHHTSLTNKIPIFGGEIDDWNSFIKLESNRLVKEYKLEKQTAELLIQMYGAEITEFVKILKEFGSKKLKENRPWLEAQILYSTRFELAQTPIDIMRRRTWLMFEEDNGLDLVDRIIEIMGKELGWDDKIRKGYKNETINYINNYLKPHDEEINIEPSILSSN